MLFYRFLTATITHTLLQSKEMRGVLHLHRVCCFSNKLMPPLCGAVMLFATRGAVDPKKRHIEILFEGELAIFCTDQRMVKAIFPHGYQFLS